MDEQYPSIFTEEERAARRAQRAEARRKKLRERRRQQLMRLVPLTLLSALLVVLLAAWATQRKAEAAPQPASPPSSQVQPLADSAPQEPETPYTVSPTPDTVQLGDSLPSSYAVVVELDSGTILAEKEARTIISPASMTKILTLLVAAEHLDAADLDDTFTMTIDITDYCYVNDCSVVGLMVGETVPVRELLYGTILSSGADAALGLATYVAGSREAFVSLMNEKLEELGLSDTAHFTNCVGLYDPAHKCTVYDMAMILTIWP